MKKSANRISQEQFVDFIVKKQQEAARNQQEATSDYQQKDGYDITKTNHFIVAIDGRCASGKTTLATSLADKLHCNCIHMDDFFLQPYQRTPERLQEPGGNVDYERFLAEVLLPLQKGEAFSYRPFLCQTMDFGEPIQVEPKSLTIIEGSYATHPKLKEYYDLTVFLTVLPEEQMERIILRNGEKAEMFRNKWIPLEEKYFETYEVAENCDYVIEETKPC